MKIIFLAGGAIFTLTLFLIISNFSLDSENVDAGIRSIDSTDLPMHQNNAIVLHETEIGNQYINPLKKSIPNSQWEETHISHEVTLSDNKVQKNIVFDYYSEMPPPSQKILDRSAEKAKNPQSPKSPIISPSENEINPNIDNAINIEEFLDKEKKN